MYEIRPEEIGIRQNLLEEIMTSQRIVSGNWLEVMTIVNDVNGDEKDGEKENSMESPILNTLPNCLTLADVHGDNYVRLVTIDNRLLDEEYMKSSKTKQPASQMRIYRGLELEGTIDLNTDAAGIPVAIESLFVNESTNTTGSTTALSKYHPPNPNVFMSSF